MSEKNTKSTIIQMLDTFIHTTVHKLLGQIILRSDYTMFYKNSHVMCKNNIQRSKPSILESDIIKQLSNV